MEKAPIRKKKLDANFSTILPQKGVPPINRSQIEAKARSIAETFTMESTCELLLPPLEVNIIGFTFCCRK
jgi:hypothetical protein